jgi:hypothetical protein
LSFLNNAALVASTVQVVYKTQSGHTLAIIGQTAVGQPERPLQ